MSSTMLLDTCGRRRSPAALSSFDQGRPPRNKGQRYPADPPTVEEIIAVMRAAGDDAEAVRLRGLIVVLWRAGLRISEGLALNGSDLDPSRGAILVRRGKGGKRREVGMDRWAWEQLSPWLELRATLPVGALFCVLRGPTRGRPWAPGPGPDAPCRRGSRVRRHAMAASEHAPMSEAIAGAATGQLAIVSNSGTEATAIPRWCSVDDRQLIWRAFCQGVRHDSLAFAGCWMRGGVVGWVGGGPAGCARRAVRLICAGWDRRTMVRRGEPLSSIGRGQP